MRKAIYRSYIYNKVDIGLKEITGSGLWSFELHNGWSSQPNQNLMSTLSQGTVSQWWLVDPSDGGASIVINLADIR